MPDFTCTQPGCGKTFAEFKYLDNHIQITHGERTYKCSIIGCDWAFKSKFCLENHIKVHQQNGRIISMAKRNKKKEPKCLMAKKLAALALKIN